MKPTLLLDLDDTLVKNDIDEFLPQYLRSFSTFVADKLDPNLFVRSLLAGTQAMVENRQPDCTLREVFKSVFYPLTRVDPATFQVVSDEFYDEIFPRLRSLTEPIPQAAELVSRAFDAGTIWRSQRTRSSPAVPSTIGSPGQISPLSNSSLTWSHPTKPSILPNRIRRFLLRHWEGWVGRMVP